MTAQRPIVRPLAAAALGVALLAGCASGATSSTGAVPAGTATRAQTQAQSETQPQTSGREDRAGHSRGRDVAASRLPSTRLPAQRVIVRLPVGWPRTVPVPAGTLIASSARGGYAALLVAPGSAAQVRRRVVTLFKAHGFVQRNGSLLVFTGHRWKVTVVLFNRDHSNLKTNVTVAVTRP